MSIRIPSISIMQHKTETDGEVQSWISEQARIDDDDDIDVMYNTSM